MSSSAEEAQEQQQQGPIIPGLPDHVALRCLAFLHRTEYNRLRCVSTQWRDIFRRGVSSLHALRRSMNRTLDYLILFPREFYTGKGEAVSYYEIQVDPSALTPTIAQKSLSMPLREEELPSLRGHACISMGPLVLLLGGLYFGPKSLNSLHIFDTTSSSWWHGASMQFSRSDFAWGVIENCLYVTGGFFDEDIGHIQQAEVYDPDADEWSSLPDMPVHILIDMYFVHKGVLYVRGCEPAEKLSDYVLKMLSYNPSSKEWTDEDWMLGTIFKNVGPLTTNRLTALQEKGDDTLYMLEVKGEPYDYYSGEFPACVKILKLAPDALEWETLFEKLDVAHRFMECPCSEAVGTHRDVCFASMGKKVIAMGHSQSDNDYEEKGEMELQATESNEVLQLSLNCPANWDAVVVNA